MQAKLSSKVMSELKKLYMLVLTPVGETYSVHRVNDSVASKKMINAKLIV